MRYLHLDVNPDGSWILRLGGFEGVENLAMVQQAALDALGELSFELLSKQPMKVIERPSDWSTRKWADERAYKEWSEERERAFRARESGL